VPLPVTRSLCTCISSSTMLYFFGVTHEGEFMVPFRVFIVLIGHKLDKEIVSMLTRMIS
jgi:hypothetical protein